MATEAVLSVINEFEFFSQDPTLTNRVQKEKGINPATWNAIVKRIEEQGGSNDQIMNILKHASEYGIMWIKVAAQLRTQPQAQAMLAEWKNLKTFKHNAYFYSSWAYFEKSRRRYDDALGVLELGRSLNAEPQHLLEPLKASILTLQEKQSQGGTPQNTPQGTQTKPVTKAPAMINKENVNSINQKTPSESGKSVGKVPLGQSGTASRTGASKLSSRKPLGLLSKTGGRAERVARDPEADAHRIATLLTPQAHSRPAPVRNSDSKLNPLRSHSSHNEMNMIVEEAIVETPYKSGSFSFTNPNNSSITPDSSLSSSTTSFSMPSPYGSISTATLNSSQMKTLCNDSTPTPMQIETEEAHIAPEPQRTPPSIQQPLQCQPTPTIVEMPQQQQTPIQSQRAQQDRALSPLAPREMPQPQQTPVQESAPAAQSPLTRSSLPECKRQIVIHSLQEWSKRASENSIKSNFIPRMRLPAHPLPPPKPLPKENEPLTFYTLQVPDWPAAAIVVNNRPFVKLTRVGKGGSSIVYKTMTEDGSIYAIKRVKMFDVDSATRDTYLEEIKLLERLQKYDAVIRLVDYELTHNQGKEYLYIVLEYAEIDMAHLLARYKVQLFPGISDLYQTGLYPENLNLIRLLWQQMLEALACVHSDEERIVHGDIKPQNFVMVKGNLKLIDFGIAKAINKNTTNIQRENLVGTLNYLAPETLSIMNQAQSKYGRASDVWALGCILFQMVYGKPPFQYQGLQTVQALQCLADPKFRIPFPNQEQLPPDLLHVMSLCLTRDPAKRPTTVQLLTHPFLSPERYLS